MIPGFNLEPWKYPDRRFKIKKLQYNRYEVDHSEVKGELRLLNVPTNVLEIPKNTLPAGLGNSELPSFLIGTQVVLAFSSKLPRKEVRVISPDTQTFRKKEITSFMVDGPSEPWNEFILEGSPPLLLRVRTIVTKLEWFEDFTDAAGGPALSVSHNVTHDVSLAPVGEAGLT
jgi:hypothetical protein